MEVTHGPEITLGSYYKLVWRRAKQLENWEWLARVGGWIVPTLMGGGILIVFGAIDLPALISGQRIGWFITGVGLLLGGLGRMAWCLIRAPHHIYAEEAQRLASVCSERDKAVIERDAALRKPSTVPVTVAHVRIEFHKFIKQGRADDVKLNLARCKEWSGEVLAYVQAALIDEHSDSLSNVRKHVLDQRYDRDHSQAAALANQCVNWIEQWQGRINADSLRPGFMVPAAA